MKTPGEYKQMVSIQCTHFEEKIYIPSLTTQVNKIKSTDVAERQTDRRTDGSDVQTERQIDGTDRRTDGMIGRRTDGPTGGADIQTDRQTDGTDRQTNRRTDRQTDRLNPIYSPKLRLRGLKNSVFLHAGMLMFWIEMMYKQYEYIHNQLNTLQNLSL